MWVTLQTLCWTTGGVDQGLGCVPSYDITKTKKTWRKYRDNCDEDYRPEEEGPPEILASRWNSLHRYDFLLRGMPDDSMEVDRGTAPAAAARSCTR